MVAAYLVEGQLNPPGEVVLLSLSPVLQLVGVVSCHVAVMESQLLVRGGEEKYVHRSLSPSTTMEVERCSCIPSPSPSPSPPFPAPLCPSPLPPSPPLPPPFPAHLCPAVVDVLPQRGHLQLHKVLHVRHQVGPSHIQSLAVGVVHCPTHNWQYVCCLEATANQHGIFREP